MSNEFDEDEARKVLEEARVRAGVAPPSADVGPQRVAPTFVVPKVVAERPTRLRAAGESDADRDARRLAKRLASALTCIPEPYRGVKLDASMVHRVKLPSAIAATHAATRAQLVVWLGSPGAGKTSLACAALESRTVSEHQATGKFVPAYCAAWKLARVRALHPLGQGEPELVERCLRADLLVLDDLGDDERTPTSAVHDVIFDRHERGAPTWYTTAFGVDEISARYGSGIARRVFERAAIVRCSP